MDGKRRQILTVLLAAVLLLTLCLPAFAAAEAGREAPDDPETAEPSEVVEVPVQEPTIPLPVVPQPVVTEAPQTTVAPAATPAAATPVPTEAAGTVNLHMYVYTASGAPAAGYSVSLSSGQATTGRDGLATFSNLPVTQQSVTITSPDGSTCTGRLYMSRSGSTGVTDQAMGGTYGVDVARDRSDLYMVVTFEPEGSLNIRTLSSSPPALPTQAATEAPSGAAAATAASYGVKALTATFLDAEGKPISGMRVGITADDGTTVQLTTDSSGSVSVPSAPYGHYIVAAVQAEGQTSQFDLTINPALRTGVSQNAGTNMIVDAAQSANHLYLQFTWTATGFVLTEASDSPIGTGADPMLVGIIVIAVAAVVLILVIVLVRRRNRARRGSVTTMQVGPQRKVNYDPSAPADQQPRRTTGGANKFDDRSKM